MQQYHDALQRILDHGVVSGDRTGVGVIACFGMQSRYPLAKGFPLMTTKRLNLRAIIHELLWFLRGDTNIAYLKDKGVSIWNPWADDKGDLGPIYGQQWRGFRATDANGQPRKVDQIAQLIEDIRRTPDSRRLIVSAWNPADLAHVALPPCHVLWQVRVLGGALHLHVYQRSADMFLGVPFNIASYGLLLCMLAHITGHARGDVIHTIGDAHIYQNHLEQVQTQLRRQPKALPELRIKTQRTCIFDFRFEDFEICGYDPDPHIAAPIAV
ncbi:MAG: thymidylate synthase [Rhodobacteraceae bacterium]|nr:thymidylate synthase [Paracoccaceae bacterium]